MRSALAASLVLACALWAGVHFQDNPYRIAEAGLPVDGTVLEHRDSPYSHITWVVSRAMNQMNMYFFKYSQGSVCLYPAWNDYQAISPELAHVAMPPGRTKQIPNPGTLTSSRYTAVFPVGMFLQRDINESGARSDILIVGLGSGVGVAVYAHHFPEAHIVAVDIDRAVVDMVRRHYPLIDWLETQKLPDGRPRLEIVVADARQYIKAQPSASFDLILLDAYGSAARIPSHLMTREFYAETAQALKPSGILLANVRGSYGGSGSEVLGSAVRTLHAAGFAYIHNFPVPNYGEARAHFNGTKPRNNILVARRTPIIDAEALQTLSHRRLYPELPAGKYVTRNIFLVEGSNVVTDKIPLRSRERALDADIVEDLLLERGRALTGLRMSGGLLIPLGDPDLKERVVGAVLERYRDPIPVGWDDVSADATLYYEEIDWVRFAREVYEDSVAMAFERSGDEYIHSGESILGDNGRSAQARDAELFTDAMPNADLLRW